MVERPILIYLIAGEPSGDAIGAHLIRALSEVDDREIEFAGLGGAAMSSCGFHSLFPISELSVMGLLEVLPHARRIMRRIDEVANDISSRQPDIVITIDSPSFSIRVAKRIAKLDVPKVHYVAPTVWAWRPWRVHKFKRYYDHLLTILPFEPPYFEDVGLPAPFVGHPVLEYGGDHGNGPKFRKRHKVSEEQILVCLLPGSRRGEVMRHLGIFGDALEILNTGEKGCRSVIPTLPHVADLVRSQTETWGTRPIILETPEEKYDAMAASNIALTASGTVALETAIARLPTVVAYRVNAVTAFIIRRLIKVDFVNILNIMADRELVPECLQEKCTAERLHHELERLLDNGGQRQIRDLESFLRKLRAGDSGPSVAAARYLFERVLPEKTTHKERPSL